MVLVKYEAKFGKFVHLLSSSSDRPEISTKMKNKPKIIMEYNKRKGGVDVMDMLLGNPSCSQPTKRWPLRIFYWLIDAVYLNRLLFTYYFYKCTIGNFRIILATFCIVI